MPEPAYWRDQLSAFLTRQSGFERDTFVINDADAERHPSDALLVVRGRNDRNGAREQLRRLATRARRCGFVVIASFGISAFLYICDRDPLAYSYHSNHEGIIGEAEP